jgi:hypothetical protein
MSDLHLNFRISKFANFYFFIQNLSEWHFSNRKQYNESWREKLQFNDQEQAALKEFGKLHQRYPFGSKYLGDNFLFLDPQQTWEHLRRDIPESDFALIKQTFDLLEPKFEQIWQREAPRLEQWQQLLEQSTSSPEGQTIEKLLSHFYQWHITEPIQADIILMLSTNGISGGSANFMDSPYALQLEISSLPIEKLQHTLMLIWHEFAHSLIVRHTDFISTIQTFLNANPEKLKTVAQIQDRQEPAVYVNEVILSSLLPTGYLRHKLFNLESYPPHNLKTDPLFPKAVVLSERYLKQAKPVDTSYLDQLI